MKYLTPRALPALSQLLPALGHPSPREIARYLDVTERTVFAWKAADRAPKSALLALFWESSFGLSTLDAELFNTAMVHKNHAQALLRELGILQVRIARLEKMGSFGSANAPHIAPVVLPVSAFS